MINQVILRGRLCHDIILRHTKNGMAVCDYTVAVNQGYGENQRADFINCMAWNKTAEFIAKYFSKGKMIEIEGRIRVNEWVDRSGNKRKDFKVIAERVEFGESKNDDV